MEKKRVGKPVAERSERASDPHPAGAYREEVWLRLTPAERLRRSWRLRRLLRNPRAVHDAKIWPRP